MESKKLEMENGRLSPRIALWGTFLDVVVYSSQ